MFDTSCGCFGFHLEWKRFGGISQYSNCIHSTSSTEVLLTFLSSQFFIHISTCFFNLLFATLQTVPFSLPLSETLVIEHHGFSNEKSQHQIYLGSLVHLFICLNIIVSIIKNYLCLVIDTFYLAFPLLL